MVVRLVRIEVVAYKRSEGIHGFDSSLQIHNSQQDKPQDSSQTRETFTEFDADAKALYKIFI